MPLWAGEEVKLAAISLLHGRIEPTSPPDRQQANTRERRDCCRFWQRSATCHFRCGKDGNGSERLAMISGNCPMIGRKGGPRMPCALQRVQPAGPKVRLASVSLPAVYIAERITEVAAGRSGRREVLRAILARESWPSSSRVRSRSLLEGANVKPCRVSSLLVRFWRVLPSETPVMHRALASVLVRPLA